MILRASAVVAFCALLALPAHAQCLREPLEYDLPPQQMDDAFGQLAQRTGCPIDAEFERFATLDAPALSGTYRPEEALWALLQGTGWEGYTTKAGLEVTQRQKRWVLERTAALRNQVNHSTLSMDSRRRYLDELEHIEQSVQEVVNDQGFVSAGELASYRRSLKALQTSLK